MPQFATFDWLWWVLAFVAIVVLGAARWLHGEERRKEEEAERRRARQRELARLSRNKKRFG